MNLTVGLIKGVINSYAFAKKKHMTLFFPPSFRVFHQSRKKIRYIRFVNNFPFLRERT